jgi:hypothetical protein
MPSSEMLSRVALVRTDGSEKRSASIIRVIGFGELGVTLDVASNRRRLRRKICDIDTANVAPSSPIRVTLFLRSVRRLLVTPNVPSSTILITLKIEALRSSETSFLTRTTQA